MKKGLLKRGLIFGVVVMDFTKSSLRRKGRGVEGSWAMIQKPGGWRVAVAEVKKVVLVLLQSKESVKDRKEFMARTCASTAFQAKEIVIYPASHMILSRTDLSKESLSGFLEAGKKRTIEDRRLFRQQGGYCSNSGGK